MTDSQGNEIDPDGLVQIDTAQNALIIESTEDAQFEGFYHISFFYKLEGTADGEYPAMETFIEDFLILTVADRCTLSQVFLVNAEWTSSGFIISSINLDSVAEDISEENSSYLMDGTTRTYTAPLGIDSESYMMYVDTNVEITEDQLICGTASIDHS